MEENNILPMDTLVMLDLIKVDLQTKLKVNMTTLNNTICFDNDNDSDDDDNISLFVMALLKNMM